MSSTEHSQLEMEIPTEIKMTYDVNGSSVSADYQYEPVYSQYKDMTTDDISQSWIALEKKNVKI